MSLDDRREVSSSRVARIRTLLCRRHSLTEIMRKTIECCRTEKSYEEVECCISDFPEFAYCDQSQSAIVEMLVAEDALSKRCVDASGNTVSSQSSEAIGFRVAATDVGLMAAAEISPQLRLETLFDQAEVPRRALYSFILAFCRAPHSFEAIEGELRSRDCAKVRSRNEYSSLPVYPSALVGELEDAGGLYWQEGWRTTPEGLKYASSARMTETKDSFEGGIRHE